MLLFWAATFLDLCLNQLKKGELFNFQKWSTSNVSPYYSSITQHIGNENTPSNQVAVVILIQLKVLLTNV